MVINRGPKADISEALRPTGNGGAGAEPPHGGTGQRFMGNGEK